MSKIDVRNMGRQDYRKMWELQKELFTKRLADEIPDTLLLVEHDPVFTIGRTGSDVNIRAGRKFVEQSGIPVVDIDRGGDITWHGPGQLVGYPILRLENYYRDVHRYLRDLEETIIRSLERFGISAGRTDGMTGVWIDGRKIAAIGVKVTRWITMHGFALNVSNELSHFDMIIPCGIRDRQVTTMSNYLDREVDLNEVAAVLTEEFRSLFVPAYQEEISEER